MMTFLFNSASLKLEDLLLYMYITHAYLILQVIVELLR